MPGDGGPPDLAVFFEPPLCVEQGASGVMDLGAQNLGGSTALDVSLSVSLPAGVTFQPSPNCALTGPTTITCDGGAVPSQASVRLPVNVAFSTALATRFMFATVRTSSVDLDAGNDTVLGVAAVTGIGTVTVNVLNRTMDAGYCGPGATSWSQCNTTNTVTAVLTFLPDAGLDNSDLVPARWQQSPSGRNVCMQSYGEFGGSVIWGSSISPTCFEGGMDDHEFQQLGIGVWRGCFP